MTRNTVAHASVSGFMPSVESVTSSALHTRTREALQRVRDGVLLAVTHYNDVEGYLVSADQMRDMTERLSKMEAREQELRQTLPLVLAAAKAGVAIPSETLARFAPGLDESWESIAEFAAAFPLRLSAGERGEPLTRGRLRAVPGPVAESGDDDELNLDA